MGGGGQVTIVSSRLGVGESQDGPDSSDGGVETRDKGRPPLVPAHVLYDIFGCEGPEDQSASRDDGRAQQ